jgi:TRAP transporter TAXI family solute receptor
VSFVGRGKRVALLALVLVLAACTNATDGLRLTIATGFPTGVYYNLGSALAKEWARQTGMPTPVVLQTDGSGDNLRRLRSGEANVAFSAADLATDELAEAGKHHPRALARIYDDYLHIAVRADSKIESVRDLLGKRVAIGAPTSGVKIIARRVLQIAGVDIDRDPGLSEKGLSDSSKALQRGEIDAFFWSGGLPTNEIVELARAVPVRLLDMTDVMPQIRAKYRYYNVATIPITTYELRNSVPVSTLVVPNLLLVTDQMSPAAAKALTQGIFEAQENLAKVNKAANSIDIRSAIETQPVPLHEGAEQFYKDKKL